MSDEYKKHKTNLTNFIGYAARSMIKAIVTLVIVMIVGIPAVLVYRADVKIKCLETVAPTSGHLACQNLFSWDYSELMAEELATIHSFDEEETE